LAHDLGNPPFGHQGEVAIARWFKRDAERLLKDPKHKLSVAQAEDFLRFEGNAQAFRILTRLQLLNDDFGLDLTYATLAALMKYPTPSDKIVEKGDPARKKHGFFQSEKRIADAVWENTGLREGLRHPLTYLMEACDDIAYTVLDAEDAVKKGLVSFSDLLGYIRQRCPRDPVAKVIVDQAQEKHLKYRGAKLSPSELNDVSMQRFRVYAIHEMVQASIKAYRVRASDIEAGRLTTDLLGVSDAAEFRRALKDFDTEHAYRHRSVLALEAIGTKTIWGLMDILWAAITEREDEGELGSRRNSPFLSYAYQRISENYRRIFENPKNEMPIRYREAQLLTDMISGMTDTFALDLLKDLNQYADRDYSQPK